MTREEAFNRIDAIIEKHEVDDVYVTITNFKDYDALRTARELLQQEPCEDVISREEAIDALNQSVNILEATDRIKDLSPAIPQPKIGQKQMIGHWIVGKYKDTCDKCRCTYPKNIGFKNYCPNCGTKMQEVEK